MAVDNQKCFWKPHVLIILSPFATYYFNIACVLLGNNTLGAKFNNYIIADIKFIYITVDNI